MDTSSGFSVETRKEIEQAKAGNVQEKDVMKTKKHKERFSEETCVQEVVSLNPSNRYKIAFSTAFATIVKCEKGN